MKPDPAPLHVSKSADRALTLLDLVATTGSLTLGEAATATDMASSTALRHLRALTNAGWLRRDDAGRYSGGPTLTRIALRSLHMGPIAQLIAAAQPQLEHITNTTEESSYLAIRDGSNAVYVATSESTRAIRHVGWVGRHAPISGTAVGESLTATVGLEAAELPVATNTGASEPDVTAITVPILDGQDVVAAFSVLGPAERLTLDRQRAAAHVLRDASAALTSVISAGA